MKHKLSLETFQRLPYKIKFIKLGKKGNRMGGTIQEQTQLKMGVGIEDILPGQSRDKGHSIL